MFFLRMKEEEEARGRIIGGVVSEEDRRVHHEADDEHGMIAHAVLLKSYLSIDRMNRERESDWWTYSSFSQQSGCE